MPRALCSGPWLSMLALFRCACDENGFAVAVDEVLLELREPGRNPPRKVMSGLSSKTGLNNSGSWYRRCDLQGI